MQDWISFLVSKLDNHLHHLEQLRLADYIRYVENRRRFLFTQLLGGVVDGLIGANFVDT